MNVIIGVSLIVFVIACLTIYHNTNAFEPRQRVVYIVLGMVFMYLLTTIICSIKSKGIHIDKEHAIDETLKVAKMLFTPVNGIIILASLRKFI